MLLKQKLLELGIVIDNEYLDKYCELIESHRNDQRIKFKTQKHHIIPKYYYKDKKIKIDSSKENIVNLFHDKHLLAHYYLCLCSINKYVFNNECSIKFVLGNKYFLYHEEKIKQELEQYYIIFEDFCRRASIQRKNKRNSIKTEFKKGQIPWSKGKSGKDFESSKTILQFDLDGNFIKEWEGINFCAKQLNICSSNIINCLKDKYLTAGGFFWFYKGDKEIETKIIKKQKKYFRFFAQFDLEWSYIKSWHSVKEAAKFCNVSTASILSCLNGMTNSSGNYRWKYIKDEDCFESQEWIKKHQQKTKNKRNKNVCQFDIKGNKIAEYNTIAEAERLTGIKHQLIGKCCKTKIKTAGGFIWKYKKP